LATLGSIRVTNDSNRRIQRKLFTESNEGNEEKATQRITYLRCLCFLLFKNLFATAGRPGLQTWLCFLRNCSRANAEHLNVRRSSLARAIVAFLALPLLVGGAVPFLVSCLAAEKWFRSPIGFVPLVLGTAILIASVV